MRYVLLVIGLALMAWGWVYDASVPSGSDYGSVMNLGLIANKQMIFGLGAVFFLAGIVLIGAQSIVEAISPAAKLLDGKTKPGYAVGPGTTRPDAGDGQY